MITLNAADEPERGFVADYTLIGQPVPWLSEWREPTISLTRTVPTSLASGGMSTVMFRFPSREVRDVG